VLRRITAPNPPWVLSLAGQASDIIRHVSKPPKSACKYGIQIALRGDSSVEATLYARDQGPQCFTAGIIFQQESTEAFVEQLRACRLTWYWHSVREPGRLPVAGQPELPQFRPLTLLTDQNRHDLVLDLAEEVDIPVVENPSRMLAGIDIASDVEYRNVMLFGLDAELAAPVETSLNGATQRFLQDLGPLEIVFDRIQDLNYEYLYFRHSITPEVRCLLNAWQLDPDHAPKVRPYKRLRISQLESILPNIKNWYHE
jgi:hypothetical protein